MSKCKPIAFRSRAAYSRNGSNQNASLLLSTSLRGMRPQGILAPSAFPWAAQPPAWEPASLLRGGDRDLSAGSLKTPGLPPKKSQQARLPAPLPRRCVVEWEAPTTADGQLTPWAGLRDKEVSLPLCTCCRVQMQGAQIMQWWKLFRTAEGQAKLDKTKYKSNSAWLCVN